MKGTHRPASRTPAWHADAPINIGLYRVYTPTVSTVSQPVHYQPPTTPSQQLRFIPLLLQNVTHSTDTREDKNLKKMEAKGRVALITGAASGIGKAYAIELLNQGAKVAICDINTEEGEKLVETLSEKYGKGRVIFSQCDVTDYLQFEESFQTTITEFGHIDIVINNAGIMNDRFWELEVDINLNGVIRGTLLAQRFMGTDRGGQGGVVINTGSNVSINPYVSVPIYSATKAALVSFTRAFGDQYHVDLTGVKVMALCPGATDTKLVRDVNRKLLLARYEDAWQKDMVSSIPQRVEHVAKALIHVLSTGKSGSVWMVEKDQPPHEISFSKH
ncbi:15-hydroxyprostaglandin dehydrogenase [NAD+] [Trachymyrmex septentrionalis]|uniref:15-hydroxyprostaglandin dehydrogenase [NAD(+)] n=1 Tax=Trachymyrmex septentrionalis TaxID=34720 RepID=A0A195EUB2_9HYME|nr:15-hydroxyprostaglandin dehydrogenase [NAD+] [Trachymyrmex septentrionalis]